jgi:hypothetical protein
MNGFISRSKLKVFFPTFERVASGIAALFSISTGVLTGYNVDLGVGDWIHSFQNQKINYGSVEWVGSALNSKVSVAAPEIPSGHFNVSAPSPLRLSRAIPVGRVPANTWQGKKNILRLRKAIESLESGSRDPFSDFRIAASLHRGSFRNLESRKTLDEGEWITGNDLSMQVPVPRPKRMIRDWKPESKKEPLIGKATPRIEEEQITFAPGLSDSQKATLTGLLLAEQVKTEATFKQQDRAPFPKAQDTAPKPITFAQNQHRVENLAKTSLESAVNLMTVEEPKPGKCGLGVEHAFEAPSNEPASSMDTQICPEKLDWISKSWGAKGWIKVEGSRHLPTLTRHPAPADGPTLLLNEIQLGALFVRTGTKITRGMGIIVGRVPDGFKVDFAGRSEETEYFESNRRKYFAILNVEPGAGVVELQSEKAQEMNATTFVPVLEDVITYLDLSEPEVRDIGVRVTKNGSKDDPEVAGLTVGLSTQTGIQAITRSDGTAVLKQVRLVKGFPAFVDINSRQGQENGYLYRYELTEPGPDGFHQVNQVAEKSLYKWLNQVKQGLSDQGAMVVGAYQRTRFDGFRNEYFAKVQPLTSKFGLEPLNYSVLWNGEISEADPLEGDLPRFMSVQVSEGLSQVSLTGPEGKPLKSDLIPVSPRVIHVVSP